MKPSQKLDKAILEYLSQEKNAVDENNLQSVEDYKNLGKILNKMYIFMKKHYGFNEDRVINTLHRMGCTKNGKRYLNICIWFSPQGSITYGPNRENLFTGWLTSRGEDYLYTLQHPASSRKSGVNNTNIGAINNSGTANVSSNINQQFNLNGNINNKIIRLSQCKVKDKKALNDLVNDLRKISNDKQLSMGRLSKFKSFVHKSWNVIGPALSDVLASLLLSRLGMK